MDAITSIGTRVDMASPNRETIVDLRQVAPQARIAAALYTSQLLRAGQAMQVIDDHDPVDLQAEFEAEPERFGWRWVERGPTVWHVSITRRALPISRGRSQAPQPAPVA
jgi:uncharacterized protein (DUF2249 family)